MCECSKRCSSSLCHAGTHDSSCGQFDQPLLPLRQAGVELTFRPQLFGVRTHLQENLPWYKAAQSRAAALSERTRSRKPIFSCLEPFRVCLYQHSRLAGMHTSSTAKNCRCLTGCRSAIGGNSGGFNAANDGKAQGAAAQIHAQTEGAAFWTSGSCFWPFGVCLP